MLGHVRPHSAAVWNRGPEEQAFAVDRPGTGSNYAKQREQYGEPIGGFQIIQHYLADMLVAYDTSQIYLYQTASIIDDGEDVAGQASVLKACINENFKFMSERSVQIHGAIGLPGRRI